MGLLKANHPIYKSHYFDELLFAPRLNLVGISECFNTNI